MSNNIQEITSKLWNMANELRGTMDASEYKNYILALCFIDIFQSIKKNI